MPKKFPALLVALVALTTALGACRQDKGELVVYSGRNENLVRPILEQFAEDTGISIRVRYGETTELTPTLLEEGDKTRADLFFSQDAGALAALAERGLLGKLPARLLDDVDDRFKDPDGRWIGVTGRARVIAYNTDELTEADLPGSVFDLADPKWTGRIGIAPTNASFVAFVSALIEQHGEQKVREWLEALKANDAKEYNNNVLILEALAEGEVSVGLVNHYYLYGEFKSRPDAPVANFFPGQQGGGEGTFINVAGIGIPASSDMRDEALQLAEYLLGEKGQRYFRDETSEYPLKDGVDPISELPPLDTLRSIDVPLSELGRDLEASQELLKDVGLT